MAFSSHWFRSCGVASLCYPSLLLTAASQPRKGLKSHCKLFVSSLVHRQMYLPAVWTTFDGIFVYPHCCQSSLPTALSSLQCCPDTAPALMAFEGNDIHGNSDCCSSQGFIIVLFLTSGSFPRILFWKRKQLIKKDF